MSQAMCAMVAPQLPYSLKWRLENMPEEIKSAWYFKQCDIVYMHTVGRDEEIANLCKLYGADEQQIIEQAATTIHEVYMRAVILGRTGLLRICKNRGLIDINRAMILAAEKGRSDIIRLCKSWGATSINEAMFAAQTVRVIKLCKELGADAFEDLAVHAVHIDKVSLLKLCKKWGVTDFNPLMAMAQRYKRYKLIQLCELYGAINQAPTWAE